MITGSNDQFAAFLQRTNSDENGVDTSFSFTSFNYGGMFHISLLFSIEIFLLLDLGNAETSTDGTFGSFFFGNNANLMNKEQTHDEKSN